MKGLDLRKLKKVSSDDNMTVFKHDMGHEIKIAHSKLSPKMRAELDKIPLHGQKAQKMANGGGPNPEPNPEPNPSPDGATDQPQTPAVPAEYTPGVSDPGPEATTGVNPNAGQQPQPQPETDEDKTSFSDKDDEEQQPPVAQKQAKAQAPSPTNIVSSPLDANTIANQLNDHYNELKTLVGNGTITPKTMHDFWAKNPDGSDRGVPSKIGMFFSMLAAGMGSGLTHQPNVIMQAMQKQIDNDIEAQKATKANQFSAWNMANQHVTALSELKLRDLQGKYQEALTKNQPVEAQKILSEIGINNANADLAKMNYAKQAMFMSVLQQAGDQVNKQPPGSMKQNMAAAHQMLQSAADSHAANQNALTGQQIENNWKNQNMALAGLGAEGKTLSDYQSERHLPGIGDASVAIPQSVRDQVNAQNILDAKGKDLMSFIQGHKGLDLSRWEPKDRAVAQQKVEEMKNFYNDSIHGGALTQGRLGWYDEQFAKNPLDILSQAMGSTAKFQEMIRSNESRLNTTLDAYGVKRGGGKPPEQAAPQGNVSKSGKQMVQKDGKWFYQ